MPGLKSFNEFINGKMSFEWKATLFSQRNQPKKLKIKASIIANIVSCSMLRVQSPRVKTKPVSHVLESPSNPILIDNYNRLNVFIRTP